ncbi:MAG TPA: CHASE4 domain-containing protein [Coleofasciculaceae cyanobacterium]|jgi:signal transduction histidine kinase/sensor domain CHASE-containing protein
MTLRQKTFLVMGITLLGLLLALSLVLSNIWSMGFERLEIQQTRRDVERIVDALADNLVELESLVGDWSPWDETYNFIVDRNAAYIVGNLDSDSISNLKLDLIIYINQAGQIVFAQSLDLQQKRLTPLPTNLQQYFVSHPQITHHSNLNSSVTGILMLPETPMMIASQPIRQSDRSGPIRGTLIFGRYLDAIELQKLAALTHLSIVAYPLQKSLPPDFQAAQAALTSSDSIQVRPLNLDRIAGYTQIFDIDHRPALLLRVDSAREIYREGQRTWHYLLQALIAVGLLFSIVALLMLENLVLSRLARLSRGVSQIRDTGNLSLRLQEGGKDELSRPILLLNQLLSTLEQSQQALNQAKIELEQRVEQRTFDLSRINEELLSEMAERRQIELQLRSSEAHLRTYSQQLEQALQQLKKTQAQLIHSEKMSSIGQLVAGVAHEINNPLGFIAGNLTYANEYAQALLSLLQRYQHYYPNPISEIETEFTAIDLEFLLADFPNLFASMQLGVDRIQNIVLALRNFSRTNEISLKAASLHEGIDSTLLILQSRLKVSASFEGITIVKDYGEIPLVKCDAGQVNQVFMNIISNAIDALEEYQPQRLQLQSEEVSAMIHIKTEAVAPRRVAIRIRDNGPGISEATQQRLFDPFFTTKPIGKGTGLGLSISYQIITEKHGGTLQCISTPGVGTEFVIELPVQADELKQDF